MSMSAPSDVATLLAEANDSYVRANLFTFSLLSGPVLRFTDWRRPIVSGGNTYSPTPRMVRGTIRVERGVTVSTQQVTLQEANSTYIAMITQGLFNRALYTMQRVFAPPFTTPAQPAWTNPLTRFAGRVNAIENITRTGAEITIKCMLDDLDKDYPLDVLTPDCNNVLFDQRCGLSWSAYLLTGTVPSGATKLSLATGLSNPDNYFTQGIVTFTSGALAGLSYLIKSHVGGVIVPSYPFLAAPAAGTTFSISPGCDKTLATCQTKYGYAPTSGAAPFFRGQPFVPDPTVTY